VYPSENPHKVADIVFSFNNAPLIEGLRARGACIAAQNFDGMRAEEAKINELFQDFDKLTIPTSAFVTFEKDDSASFADIVKNSPDQLLGSEFKFDKPSEPTDIIWENRHYTSKQYFWRQLFAFTIIGVLLAGSAVFIYWISAFSAELASVFPSVDCKGISDAYGSSLQTYAVQDYDFISENEGMPSSGCLQCFCIDEYKKDHEAALTNSYGQANGEPICKGYYD
jgi:hypothetical protein